MTHTTWNVVFYFCKALHLHAQFDARVSEPGLFMKNERTNYEYPNPVCEFGSRAKKGFVKIIQLGLCLVVDSNEVLCTVYKYRDKKIAND